MPALTPDDIQHLARLARLDIAPTDSAHYAAQLGRLFDLFAALQAIDTAEVGEVFASFGDLAMTPRADDAGACLPADVALARSGRRAGEFIAVPRVLAGAPESD